METVQASCTHHDRLKNALLLMLGVEPSQPMSRRSSFLAGSLAAPDARLLHYREIRKAVKEANPSGWILDAPDKELSLSGSDLLAKLLTPPMRTLAVQANLSYVDLSGNQLTALGTNFLHLRTILFQLARMPSLRFLSLHNNMLMEHGASIVARLLRTSPSLKYLDVSRNSLGEKGAHALAAAFAEDGSEALEGVDPFFGEEEELDAATGLAAGGAAAAAGDSDAEAEAAAAASGKSSSRPSSAGRAAGVAAGRPPRPGSAARKGAEGAASAEGSSSSRPSSARSSKSSAYNARVPAIYSTAGLSLRDVPNAQLEWLNLSDNNLCSYGLEPKAAMTLLRSVAEHPGLKWLDISRNSLTRSTVTALTLGLEINTGLETLIMESNEVDGTPASRIADVARKHPKLRHLSLRFNRIRSEGAMAFASLLASKAGLLHLDLRDNHSGPVGTRAVLLSLGVEVHPSIGPSLGITPEEDAKCKTQLGAICRAALQAQLEEDRAAAAAEFSAGAAAASKGKAPHTAAVPQSPQKASHSGAAAAASGISRLAVDEESAADAMLEVANTVLRAEQEADPAAAAAAAATAAAAAKDAKAPAGAAAAGVSPDDAGESSVIVAGSGSAALLAIKRQANRKAAAAAAGAGAGSGGVSPQKAASTAPASVHASALAAADAAGAGVPLPAAVDSSTSTIIIPSTAYEPSALVMADGRVIQTFWVPVQEPLPAGGHVHAAEDDSSRDSPTASHPSAGKGAARHKLRFEQRTRTVLLDAETVLHLLQQGGQGASESKSGSA